MSNDYLDSLNRYGGYEAPAITIGSLVFGYSIFLTTSSKLFLELSVIDRIIMSVIVGGVYIIPLGLLLMIIPIASNWKRGSRKVTSIAIILVAFLLAGSNLSDGISYELITTINEAWNATV